MEPDDKKSLIVLWGIVWEWIIVPTVIIYTAIFLNRHLRYFLPSTPADSFFTVIFTALGFFLTITSYLQLTSYGKGTIIPFCAPPCQLVTRGVYSYCRNPMYLGYILLFFGFSVYTHSLLILMVALAGIGLFLIFYIKLQEEKVLSRRFGDSYRLYRIRTPFLIPSRSVPPMAHPYRFFFFLHVVIILSLISFGTMEAFYFPISITRQAAWSSGTSPR